MKYKVTFTVGDRDCEKSLVSVSHKLASTPIYATMLLNTGSKCKIWPSYTESQTTVWLSYDTWDRKSEGRQVALS